MSARKQWAPKLKPIKEKSAWVSFAAKPETTEPEPEVAEPGLMFPSIRLLDVMNEIGIPHSSEIESEHWVSYPLVTTNTELWKKDDKVSFSRLKVYILNYIHKNKLVKNGYVFPDELLQVLDEEMDMERITFHTFYQLLESHLYTE